MKPIRNSAKAIIVENDQVLAARMVDGDGDWYALPGGGQQRGETLVETVKRECLEEIGTSVHVHEMRFIREYIAEHHEFANYEIDVHQIEFMFRCTLESGSRPVMGSAPDARQIGLAWLPLDRLGDYRLYPLALRSHAANFNSEPGPLIYLGDVN